jgi:diguanylate cyclase (GGDEF)-like protein/PAS domain S-box-containing protein
MFRAVLLSLHEVYWLQLVLVAAAAALGVYLGARAAQTRQTGSAEARRQWARRLADASSDGLLVHRNGTILQMNRALVRMLGYREVDLLGTPFANLAAPSQIAALRTELEAPQPRLAEFLLLAADKSERIVELASHNLEIDGLPATVTAIRNLTAERALEARLAFLMQNDLLTGLANAAMFSEKLQESVTRNDSAGGTSSVLTLELQQLKAVNDQLGRSGGDNLLRQIANRLAALVHEDDIVARLGGNQFAILQPHAGAPNRTLSLASQIESALEEPFIVEGKAVRASMAIGIATYPEHATSAEGLINASGFALGKALAKGGAHSFSHAEAATAGFSSAAGAAKEAAGLPMLSLEEQRLAHDLRLAIPRGEISLEYQPVYGGKYLGLAGFEALARWRHPKHGAIPPSRFIPLADDAGLSGVLGNFILETACAEAMRCKAPTMAIKLSPMQLRDLALPARLREALLKTGLAPDRLDVQVPESALLENAFAGFAALKAIRDIGVTLTLDDFGTGLASFSNLPDFPFNRLKIDKRHIQLLGEDGNAQAIVTAMLILARGLHLEVTAEGIESEAQLSFLQAQDCHFLQGHHLGRPAPQALGFPSPAGSAMKPSLVIAQR